MRNTHKLAIEGQVSREVLMVGHSKEDNSYKVQVRVSTMNRTEMNYYFIPERAGSIQAACDQAVDIATQTFLGLYSPEEVKELPKQEIKDEVKEESKQEVAKESKPKKSSKKSDKESKQEKVETSEEMEEVESPFKAESPKESKEEKVSKKSAGTNAEPYDREDATSRASFTTYCTRLHNGSKEWKKNPDLKEISQKLHGRPFLNKDGSIDPTFEAKAKELFGIEEDEATL
jgi:hypothetical protein